jgi:hypothetical protein
VVGGEIENLEKSSRGKRARREKKREKAFPSSSVQSYIPGTNQNQKVRRLPYVVRIHHSTTLSLPLSIPTSQEANARERLSTQIIKNYPFPFMIIKSNKQNKKTLASLT